MLPLRPEQARKGCLGQSKAVSLAQLYSVSCKHLQKSSRCLWSPDPGMGSRIQPRGNISCQEHEQGASQASSHHHQTSSGRRQTKPPLSSTPFPLTTASGRQHESRNIFAEGKGGFFFFLPCYTDRYGYEGMVKPHCLNRCHYPTPTVSFPDPVLIWELVVQVDFLHILISVGISALP